MVAEAFSQPFRPHRCPIAENRDPHAPEPVSDAELIDRVLAGDPDAERALYDAHVDRVFRLVYRMAGDLDRAQDWVQETFIRALRSEEHTSELQSQSNLVCRLLLEKKKKNT